jgi:hypothetical protein
MNSGLPISIPWAMHLKAVATKEPLRLARLLTGAILGCGGWVLGRMVTEAGMIRMVFEFERRACLDIYSVLIAAGLELSPLGHMRMTELFQCTRNRQQNCAEEIASVELEIQTFQRS